MSKIVFLGAGAIGRGYLPWVFEPGRYEYVFVDSNPGVVRSMSERKRYRTWMVRKGLLESRDVAVGRALLPEEFRAREHEDADAVFVSVGPRNVPAVAPLARGLGCPIVVCENDPASVDVLKRAVGSDHVFFAVPDVIASNRAPPHLLAEDPLATVTEEGTLFVDRGARRLEGNYTSCSPDELSKQWTAKLYLHNTPHCVAAYLGALCGVSYMHEAMRIPEVRTIVQGAMDEMLTFLKLRWEIPHPFLEWYAAKELARFSSESLFDPISRVAREPLRKLELEGRLVGAAQLCLAHGFASQNLLLGIAAALLFVSADDADSHLPFLRRALEPEALLTHVLGLRRGEALEIVLRERLPGIVKQLEQLPRQVGASP